MTPDLDAIGALGDAIEDLRRGCPGLTREQFGVKEYDRWTSQRSDLPDESTGLACVRYLTAIRDDPALMGGVS